MPAVQMFPARITCESKDCNDEEPHSSKESTVAQLGEGKPLHQSVVKFYRCHPRLPSILPCPQFQCHVSTLRRKCGLDLDGQFAMRYLDVHILVKSVFLWLPGATLTPSISEKKPDLGWINFLDLV